MPPKSTVAMIRFMTGPPSITVAFLGTESLVEDAALVARLDSSSLAWRAPRPASLENRPVLDTRSVSGSSPGRGGNMPIIRM